LPLFTSHPFGFCLNDTIRLSFQIRSKFKLAADSGNNITITRPEIEMNFCNFITYRNFEKTPILRGLQAPKILRHIKIYRKFS